MCVPSQFCLLTRCRRDIPEDSYPRGIKFRKLWWWNFILNVTFDSVSDTAISVLHEKCEYFLSFSQFTSRMKIYDIIYLAISNKYNKWLWWSELLFLKSLVEISESFHHFRHSGCWGIFSEDSGRPVECIRDCLCVEELKDYLIILVIGWSIMCIFTMKEATNRFEIEWSRSGSFEWC